MKRRGLALTLAGALVGVSAVVGLAFLANDWGTNGTKADLAGWVEAIATALAFAAAVVAAVYAYHAYRIEERRDQRLISDIQQAQASRVAGWKPYLPPELDSPPNFVAGGGHTILLRNASDLPVTDVSFTVDVDGFDDEYNHTTVWAGRGYLAVLPPAAEPITANVFDDAPFHQAVASLRRDPSPNYQVKITFTDTNGKRWTRDERGELKPGESP